MMISEQQALDRLLAYCRSNDWAGYDPYDALNSRLLKALPFLDFKLPRLVFTQALKRSAINVRPFALVPKTQNPKAMGLFLSAFVKLSKSGAAEYNGLADLMIERLIALRSPGTAEWCWGYSFPWQMRTELVPRGAPNLVCTTFAMNGLLDAYEQNGDPRCLEMARSAAEYMLSLYWTEGRTASFCYPLTSTPAPIHNANFLAAALLCRVHRHTGEKKFLAPALASARYSASQQATDGSWKYGMASTAVWIDNFHTGFNLCALRDIGHYAETTEFEESVRRGYTFYRNHFFREDGAAKYYHNEAFPIDIHSVAQSIITLDTFRDIDAGNTKLARNVLAWAMRNMWDERGYFYYRVLRTCTIRTPYMRWSQAWMVLALATLVTQGTTQEETQDRKSTMAVSGKV
jgi:hypothetical protein